jgi:hypothetical protein
MNVFFVSARTNKRHHHLIVGGLPRSELHSRYYLQWKDALSVGQPWLPRRGTVPLWVGGTLALLP